MAKRPLARVATPAQPAAHIFARSGRGVGQPALGGHRLADALHLLALQDGDSAARDADKAVLSCGVSHLHQRLRAPVERDVHLPAESRIGDGQMVLRDQFSVEPGRPVAPDLTVQVEGGQGADRKVLGPGWGVIGDTPLCNVIGDFPMVGVDAST